MISRVGASGGRVLGSGVEVGARQREVRHEREREEVEVGALVRVRGRVRGPGARLLGPLRCGVC